MRVVIGIFISLVFFGCGSSTPSPDSSYPSWYSKRMIQPSSSYELIGYGEGKNFNEAQAKAKKEIAQTLSSKVKSSFNSSADGTTFISQSNLEVTSSFELQNVEVIKQATIDGRTFVVVMYENLDLAYRVKRTLHGCSDEKVNTYIKNTALFASIKNATGCSLNINLRRLNKRWNVTHKENIFVLNRDNFDALYSSVTNDTFSFKASKKVLQDGDSFHFTFEVPQEGYITLLDVYENGIVTLLQASTKITTHLQVPSKESQNYLEAGLVNENEDTYDLYVAVYSKEALDMTRYEYANENLESNELSYKFGELIDSLDNYEYATVLLRTKVKPSY